MPRHLLCARSWVLYQFSTLPSLAPHSRTTHNPSVNPPQCIRYEPLLTVSYLSPPYLSQLVDTFPLVAMTFCLPPLYLSSLLLAQASEESWLSASQTMLHPSLLRALWWSHALLEHKLESVNGPQGPTCPPRGLTGFFFDLHHSSPATQTLLQCVRNTDFLGCQFL